MTDLSLGQQPTEYKAKQKIRLVTAASLFDGHDASINIMRRILQATFPRRLDPDLDRPESDLRSCDPNRFTGFESST